MYLMHSGKEPIHDVVQGRLYTFIPNEPLKIADNFIGHAILRHKAPMGLIEVPATEDRFGIHVDVAAGEKIAAQAQKRTRRAMVEQYIRTQREDRLRFNMPALPPHGTVAKIILEEGIKLPFVPVGGDVEFPTEAQPQPQEAQQLAAQVAALQQQVAALTAALAGSEKPQEPAGKKR